MSSSRSLDSVEIRHTSQLLFDVKRLLHDNDDFSDLTLIVEGVRLRVHRVVLASRSNYFRALLYGGMKEVRQNEIELQDTDLASFQVLLEYIYSGIINLSSLKVDVLVGVLALANQYSFPELERDMIFHMKSVLNEKNVCSVYATAISLELNDLALTCAKYIDRSASRLLESDDILDLSPRAIQNLLARDTLCASEIEIVRMVTRWANLNRDPTGLEMIREGIRWELLSEEELLWDVRQSSLLSSDKILDVLATKTAKTKGVSADDCLLWRFRGFLDPGVNVASVKRGTTVTKGDVGNNNGLLHEGEEIAYDQDRGSARHLIEEKSACIIVTLGMPCIINLVKFLLWDKDARSYSYYVEISVDGEHWTRVADYSQYFCRSWQEIYFPPCTVRHIKLVGTMNTNGRFFNLVKLEAYWMENIPNLKNGIIFPSDNVCSIAKHAVAIEGVSRTRNALINNSSLVYDWDNGYTCHQIGSGHIVVQLNQPYILSSLRMLLWDIDDRTYTYGISTSVNNRDYAPLLDTRNDPRRSWQGHKFAPRVCCFIRLTGLSNTANEVFHVVHLESPDQSLPKEQGSLHLMDVDAEVLNPAVEVPAVEPPPAQPIQPPLRVAQIGALVAPGHAHVPRRSGHSSGLSRSRGA